MNFECGTSTLEAEDNLGGAAFPRKCNCWHCETCAPRKRARLIHDIAAGQPNRFITITCRENQFPTPEIGAERLAWFWKIAVQRWRRLKPGNTCEFAVVREAQENGWPHLHIAWRGAWLDWDWLKQQATELLNSPHVDINYIYNPKRAARYIAKYLGKAPHRFGTLKRYWFSRNYRVEKPERRPSVFGRFKRFRDYGRPMHEVRRFLESIFVEFEEHPGGAITWDNHYHPAPPYKPPDRLYWRYSSGIPRLVRRPGRAPRARGRG